MREGRRYQLLAGLLIGAVCQILVALRVMLAAMNHMNLHRFRGSDRRAVGGAGTDSSLAVSDPVGGVTDREAMTCMLASRAGCF